MPPPLGGYRIKMLGKKERGSEKVRVREEGRKGREWKEKGKGRVGK